MKKENLLFNFNVACPMYGKQVVSLNNIHKWLRYKKSEISNKYKNMLKEWHIPEPIEQLDKAWVKFELFRHNGKVLDADNLGIIIKWTIDAIMGDKDKKTKKRLGWLKDDNQITYSVFPSIMDRTLSETEIKVSMFREFGLINTSQPLFEFNVACPRYKQEVISLNNVHKWLRFQKSKISNGYKDMLKEWHIPEPTDNFNNILIEFRLFRHNGKVLDADNLGFIIKWTIDAIKDKGWMKDDNQVVFTVFPSITDRTLIETEIKVSMFPFNSYKDKRNDS